MSMKDEPKISVVVPIYNAEMYLLRCIESIIKQTYSNLQIVLVDDGSTDRSGEICDCYAKTDMRIQVFHTANNGLVAARKFGLSHSLGEYIGFVDADDYIESDMYEKLANSMCSSKADFAHMGYINEERDHCETVMGFQEKICNLQTIEERESFLKKYILCPQQDNYISYSIWSKLYKSELIKKSYFFLEDDWQYGEDLYALCLCILQSRRISLVRQALYHYVAPEQSMSRLTGISYQNKEIELCSNIVKTIRKFDVNIYTSLQNDIRLFVNYRLWSILENSGKEHVDISRYYIKNPDCLRDKRIAIYGAGKVGRDLWGQLNRYKDIKLVAWFDSDWENCQYEYADVLGINELCNYDFDLLLIAVRDKNMAKTIKYTLLEAGQSDERIKWIEPCDILNN